MIDPWLLERLACPRCHGALIAQSIESVDGFFSLNAQFADLDLLGPAIAGWSRSRTRPGASASGTHRSFARPTAST